jgi:acyl-CoA thioesterase-2
MSANKISAPGGARLARLLDVLDLRREPGDLFIGSSPDPDALRVFGGQVAAQATMAAARCVPGGRRLVSLQCTFVRMANPAEPIQFQVDPVGDGRSFTFQRVVARQGERLVFTALASFHAGGDGPSHELPGKVRAAPERLASYEPGFSAMLTDAFELRRGLDPGVDAERGLDLAVKAARPLPDDPHLHAALVVWASDMFILDASLLPHQSEPNAFGAYTVATVDHAVHLHAPVRLDEWVVNRFESPLGGGGLSEVRCEMRTLDGALVASAIQHALLVHNRP